MTKKLVAWILVLSLALSMFTANIFVSAEDVEIWDGKTITAPADSNLDGIYEITSGAELAYIIANGGVEGASSFILTNDIYLNDITKINWQTGEVADGYTVKVWDYRNKHFNGGKIDGNGYVVYGLYYKEENPSYSSHPNSIGLIPRLAANANLEITNLGVDYAYFNYYATASAFIGTAMGGNDITISNSFAGENVTIEAANTGVFRGNTYGDRIKYMRLTDCYSLATTIPHTKNNGLIATQSDNYSGYKGVIITNCYNAKGPLNGGDNAAAVTTAANSYEAVASTNNKPFVGTLVAENNMKGAAALVAMPLGEAYVATDSYPVLKTFVKTPETPDEPEEPTGCAHTYYDAYHASCLICGEERDVEDRPIEVWNKTTAQPTVTDKDGNILIGKASELAYIIANGGGEGKTYKLIADIYLNNVDKVNWTTGVAADGYTANAWYDHGKVFQGTIDGDGHVIYGLYQNVTGSSNGLYGCGLIPKVDASKSVTIKNLGVDKSYVKSHSVSAFVGVSGNGSTIVIDKCYAGADVTLIAGRDAGAFGGRIQGTITVTNSYSQASITGGTSQGLLGDVWASSTITNCYNTTGAISYGTNTSYFVKATNCYEITKSQSANGSHIMKTPTIITVNEMKGTDTVMALGDAFVATDSYPILKAFRTECKVHIYDNGCDATCNTCGEIRDDLKHTYDNACDTTCNACDEEREVGDHNFVNAFCSECGEILIWNGTHDTAPVDSDNDGVYEITKGEELAWVIATGNVAGYNYKLTSDIYLNDITKVNWQTGEVASGYTVNKWFDEYWNKGNTVMFAGGSIDGQGHVVYGLYWEGKPAAYDENNAGTGLIPVIAKNAAKTEILNLGIDYAYMNHQRSASAFVGAQRDNTVLEIDSCYVGANVTLKAADAGAFRGYARATAGGKITNCYSLATVTGTVKHGLIAMIWDNTNLVIENCFNAKGPVCSFNNAGNVASANNFESYDENYDGSINVLKEGVTSIYAAYMMGTDVFTNNDKMSGMNSAKYVAVLNDYPQLKSFFVFGTVEDGKHYVGRQYNEESAYFVNVDNNADYFWRYNNIHVNLDNKMDICDLVYLAFMDVKDNNAADINKDGKCDNEDILILRKALIGKADYTELFTDKETYTINNASLSGVYTYVWGDEFDGNGLNSNNWSTETKMGGREVLLVENTSQTTSVSDGNLTLTAYKDADGNYHVPNSVHTKGTMNYKYGYVEIRAKLSQEVGSFASFWTRSVSDNSAPESLINGTLDHYAEVDMFETFQKNGVQKVGGNILKNFPGQDKSWYATAMTNTQQYAFGDEEYHVYGYEWTPYEINLYIDGVLYAKLDITETWTATTTEGKGMDGWNTVARVDETETGMESFHEAQYLIFNHHLHYAGAFTASTSVTENEDFSSAEYVIDYCRVYQVQSQGEFASLK